jgi:MscS family membrane protein
MIQDFLTHFQSEDYPWLWQVFAVVVVTLIANFVASRFLNHLEKQLLRTKNLWDDALLAAIRKPVTVIIWLLGFSVVLDLIKASYDAAIFDILDRGRAVVVIVVLIWFLSNLVKQVEQRLIEQDDEEKPVDHTTVRAMAKLLRIAIMITGALVILQTLGYSISGVLAFGGIGGIAVGFAAKDLLANFFGGLMIYLDRPFAVGDWVRSPDQNIEGTVEDIGWRLTRIRTFDKRPLYVPNSTFTQISVENPSRMEFRRIKETFGLRYQDISQVSAIVEDVKAMLTEHPDIAADQTLIVNFDSFSASSIDFFIYTFTKTTNWVYFHTVKQDVLLKVAEIVHKHGSDIAFPTRTLHLNNVEQESEFVALSSGDNKQLGGNQ